MTEAEALSKLKFLVKSIDCERLSFVVAKELLESLTMLETSLRVTLQLKIKLNESIDNIELILKNHGIEKKEDDL